MISRLRFRLSLRTLFVLTTLLCVWLGLAFTGARRQRRVVEAIESDGGSVSYAHEYDFTKNQWREGEPPGPEWLRSLLGRHFFDTVIAVSFNRYGGNNAGSRIVEIAPLLSDLPSLHELSLSRCDLKRGEVGALVVHANPEKLVCGRMEIDDRSTELMAKAERLREIGLNDVIISSQGVANFKNLPNLEDFWLCCRHMEHAANGMPIWDREKYALGDDKLAAFLEFPRLRRLSLTWTQISDEGVKTLSGLTQLESFAISSPRISDVSMLFIAKLKNIAWLGIGGTNIGDATLNQLGDLKKLTGLRLSAAVTNDGLRSVAELDQLETLDLGGKQIDDNGLAHLHGMTGLKRLDVSGTAVTTDGPAVNLLKKALPNCSVRQWYPSQSFR